MSSTLFTRIRPRTAVATLATGGIALCIFTRLMITDAHAASHPTPPKVFGGGPSFIALPLESAEQVNHDTKRLRFKLPTPDSVSGLPLTSSLLTVSWPKGSWTPVARPYTPISTSDEPGHIDFLVKKYPNGKQSTHLHALQPGDTLRFAVPLKGPQWKPSPSSSPEHITLVAGGAGITPVYQLLQGILADKGDLTTTMTLVYGVNTEKDTLLRDEFRALEKQHPGRFRAVYTVTAPEQDGQQEIRKGRVTKELLDELVPASQRGRAYVCGPPSMEASLTGGRGASDGGILQQLGYRKVDIFRF
ncbi:oxidoreductase NAD-binding domain-containing protein [Emericellopsis atlantica]|uniref:NADH-cytochrome b5 reductase n=1 Tax=Emericellopsis atlantica TaxID=2614577 RepID=A0A9P7ZT01_9HYPO|nr:oxidoreductase NAD-binding domain-containing protein [Emericellopsis atlantica]KAG9257710.1 oxidoreductase NAD-binding domain-containing protein [Emericellopsis atlantica]